MLTLLSRGMSLRGRSCSLFDTCAARQYGEQAPPRAGDFFAAIPALAGGARETESAVRNDIDFS